MTQLCPVCEGKGKVKGFYPDVPDNKWIECRACHGRGVVQDVVIGTPYPMPYPVPQPYPVYPSPPVAPWRPPLIWFGDPPPVSTGGVSYPSDSTITVTNTSGTSRLPSVTATLTAD